MGKSLKSFGQWRLEENISNYGFYKRQLKRLVISMFKWSNLPDGISERFIEECLYYDGYIIFFKATQGALKGSYVVSKATPYSKNIYNEPTHYKAYCLNPLSFYKKDLFLSATVYSGVLILYALYLSV